MNGPVQWITSTKRKRKRHLAVKTQINDGRSHTKQNLKELTRPSIFICVNSQVLCGPRVATVQCPSPTKTQRYGHWTVSRYACKATKRRERDWRLLLFFSLSVACQQSTLCWQITSWRPHYVNKEKKEKTASYLFLFPAAISHKENFNWAVPSLTILLLFLGPVNSFFV
jgi:hypothetical protein